MSKTDVRPVRNVQFDGIPTDVPPLPKIVYPVTPILTADEPFSILTQTKNEIDLIIPNLYLGELAAANDISKLKELNITHVLTIEDNPLDAKVFKHFEKYKFKQLADHQYSDILGVMEECLMFIDEAINEDKNILVHWLVGILLILYLMNFLQAFLYLIINLHWDKLQVFG